MSTLEDIFHDSYSIAQPKTQKYLALRAKEIKFWEYIEEALGKECLDKYWDDLCAIEDADHFHYFREGFLLGASLMLELRT